MRAAPTHAPNNHRVSSAHTHEVAAPRSTCSGSALEAAVAAAEDYIGRLARAAGQSAAEGKRKTIMDGDIEKARQVTG